MKSYISIHDVAPHNLGDIENIIQILINQFYINKICILVIPGLNWKKHQIQKLRSWQNDCIEIAAHGWNHQAEPTKSFYHKIHSVIMSDNCAEHLSKDKKTIFNIMKNSYDWFIINGFQKPRLYVPPAWALGKIKTQDLSQFNFTHFECTTGVIYNKKYRFVPLLGFEERTIIKSLVRRFFNFLNYFMAYFTGIIRIAIHPDDFNLYLKKDVFKYLSKSGETILLHELN